MKQRTGFTLVELLVVIGIMLLLALAGAAVFNANRGSDRIRSAARTAQSTFRGAVDRAIHAKENRGIRLIRDPNDPSLVTAFVYLAPLGTLSYGQPSTPIRILRPDTSPADGQADSDSPTIVEGLSVDWVSLADSGVLPYPRRVRIPASPAGRWYTFTNVVAGPAGSNLTYLYLTAPFAGPEISAPSVPALESLSTNASAEIELGFELLSNHQPISLSSGVAIDLDWSGRYDPDPTNPGSLLFKSLLTLWPAGENIDVIFTPRGGVHGRLSALGPLYFLLNDIGDATRDLNPIDSANKGEKLVLAIFPQTGNVATFDIAPTDADNDGNADDLFRFAKIGSEAGR
jgi:prepilin-type N-terminal cleavage/methylation domain-containing protein